MKTRRPLAICFLAFSGVLASAQTTPSPSNLSTTNPTKAALAANYGKLPLSFEANQGQTDPQVRFTSRGNGYSLFLTNKEAVLSLTKAAPSIAGPEKNCHPERSATKWSAVEGPAVSTARNNSGCPIQDGSSIAGLSGKSQISKTDTIRMQLAGANPNPKVSGENQLPGTANYFVGNDPTKWQTGIPTYSKIKYTEVYPGVDLTFYGNGYGSQKQLEYDFVVAPGADPKQVKLHFAGAQKLKVNADGDLMIVGKNGEIAFHKPVVYQLKSGQLQSSQRTEVNGKFVLLAGNSIGFTLGDYDRSREVVIDPTLEYSTYLGSTGSDYAAGIAVDSSGNTYVTGYTYSTKFPTTTGAFQTTNAYTANTDQSAVFLTKLNAGGTELVYSTYLTGTEYHCSAGPNYNSLVLTGDFGSAVAVDKSGDAYVTGGTCANDFPTTKGAYLTTDVGADHHASNAFITKLNPAGSALVYSTYLGGQGASYSGDWANGIVIDTAGDAYVTGQSSSPNFPTTTGAFQTVNNSTVGRNNAFVTKMNPTGTALVYSTYLGGSGNTAGGTSPSGDSGSAIAINGAGNAYITGYTYSNNFPLTTATAYQKTNKAYANGGSCPFITEMSVDGKSLVYSTYFGGTSPTLNNNDSGNGIALDSSSNIYVGGGTASTDFPVTSEAYQKAFGGHANGFVAKFNPSGSSLLYSTYLGGSGNANAGQWGDRVEALAVDPLGDVFVTGYTGSKNFPLAGTPYQSTNKGYSTSYSSRVAFLTELNPSGSELLYSTYFGGSGSTTDVFGDYGDAMAYSAGGVYFAGAALSTNFPVTSDAYQMTNKATAGNTNAFLAKFEFATASKTTLVSDGNPEPVGAKVTFTADVTPSSGDTVPTGTVSFTIDGGTPVVVKLDDTGHAAYSATTLAEGVHTVVATYSGDALNLPSSATLSQTIYGAATALTVVSGSGQTSVVGTAFPKPLEVIAKDAKGDVVPGAIITFSGTNLKFSSTTATTGTTGEASVTATPTAAGALTATATDGTLKATFALTGTLGTVAEPGPTTFSIAEATTGATVYYTTNGTTPTTGSTKYTGPITVTATTTFKFIAVKTSYTTSPVRTITITVD